MDLSNGYEGVAAKFLAGRGSEHSAGVGVSRVRDWARTLQREGTAIDLGCGTGLPLTAVLVGEGLNVFGIDAAPSLVHAFRRNLPETPVACEAVQESRFFDRTFDAVLAWGLLFLLSSKDQARLLQSIARILNPGGRLLFTSPVQPVQWKDAMTRQLSRSLGAEAYRNLLAQAGITVLREYEDEGQNHYYETFKP